MSNNQTQYKIQENDQGMRLDRWLCQHFEDLPYTVWAKLCRKGSVRLNGKRVKGHENIRTGDCVRVPPPNVLDGLKQKGRVKKTVVFSDKDAHRFESMIVYQNDNLICINKPSGLASQGGSKIKESVDQMAKSWGSKQNLKPKLLHRLDRDTSGLLLLAKNDATARKIGQKFKNGLVKKFYIAILQGVPHPLQSRIIAPIEKGTAKDKEMMVISESGKKTVTDYEIIEHLGKKVSIVLLSPETGRTHQLRLHMAYLKTPIVGDFKYGQGSYLECDDLCLHAYTIKIPELSQNVHCSLPSHMANLLEGLGIKEGEILKLVHNKISSL